jgi:hypothetical protein
VSHLNVGIMADKSDGIKLVIDGKEATNETWKRIAELVFSFFNFFH